MIKEITAAVVAAATSIYLGSIPPNPRPSQGPRYKTYPVMLLGDSITYGTGSTNGKGYRVRLNELMGGAVEWRGSQSSAPFRHEGHGGWTIDELGGNARSWANLYWPTFVVLHAGTNDGRRGDTAAQMLSDMNHLLDEVITGRPNVTIIVAQIPLTPSITQWQQDQEAIFNANLPALAATKSRVSVIDLSQAHISSDGIHPDDAGYEFMAVEISKVLPRSCVTPSACGVVTAKR